MSTRLTKEEILAELEETQKERREYVKNIGIEYRFGCLEEKRGDSCHLLGEYMEAIEQNYKKSYELFRDNCEIRKYPKSCFKYAMYLLNGKECEPSFIKMLKPLEIACADNLPPGCRYLGLVNWNGVENQKPNSKKSEEAMKKACDLEDPEACWMLSTWYLGSQTKFKTKGKDLDKQKQLGELEKNPERALEYGIRACEMNVPQSCANVSRMFRIGDGIPENVEKAKEYHDKAAEIITLLKSRNANAGFTGA
uniref:Uncharacterized protein n=1 Tax=Panagrolaimus superbus TaxID=310955 RepID=A0A914Z4A7_9BILA